MRESNKVKLGLLVAASAFSWSASVRAEPSYDDVRLCTNAYNHLWWSFETITAQRLPPAAATQAMTAQFIKVADPNIHFGLINLPLPPLYNTVTSFAIDGIPALVATAVNIGNYGEHHIATPFSVKSIPSPSSDTRSILMTTRDVDFTRNPTNEGGCMVFLSQKDVVCNVRGHGDHKKALIKSLVDNVVSTYPIDAPGCGLWIGAPVTPYD